MTVVVATKFERHDFVIPRVNTTIERIDEDATTNGFD